jgi:hypothetical protein
MCKEVGIMYFFLATSLRKRKTTEKNKKEMKEGTKPEVKE